MTGPVSDAARARFLEQLLSPVWDVAEAPDMALREMAERLVREQRVLKTIFGSDADLFHDSTRDLLLQLYLNRSIKEAESATTDSRALRQLDRLERRGLIETQYRNGSARLSSRGLSLIETYLEQLIAS